MAIWVPPSLGQFPATSAPIYLSLRYQRTVETQKWRKVVNVAGGNEFILPPPKFGLGMGTQAVSLDEVSMWSANVPWSDRARMILGDTAYYAIGAAKDALGMEGADYDYITGGASVPKELSALQYKGMKKRAYNFSFQLFAYDSNDTNAITNFVTTMHTLCMPVIGTNGIGTRVPFAPAIFQPRIVDASMSEQPGWLLSPQPCTMLTFNSSAGQYASAENGKPAIITISMVMAEIEPVIVNESGAVVQVHTLFSET